MGDLRGKTLFITGATRGIGLAIAVRAARDGANVTIAAKTDAPHPKLRGTIHTAAAEIEAAGGRALPCVVDVRDEAQIAAAVARTVDVFGGLDILVANASAIQLSGTVDTPMKRFDLMHTVNTRGTFASAQACIPHLQRAANPHILALAPPLRLEPRFFAPHLAYSIAKFGMSLCVLGLAAELAPLGVAVNALWPRTIIATAAVENLLGGAAALKGARTPEIVADAAYEILRQPARDPASTGRFLIDEEVLAGAGVTDFGRYAVAPGAPLIDDLFV